MAYRSSNGRSVLSTRLENGGPSSVNCLLIIPQSSDARPLQRSQALSTTQFCRAGQLATADACLTVYCISIHTSVTGVSDATRSVSVPTLSVSDVNNDAKPRSGPPRTEILSLTTSKYQTHQNHITAFSTRRPMLAAWRSD